MQEGNTTLIIAVEKGIPLAVRFVLLHKANLETRTKVLWCFKGWLYFENGADDS